MPRALWTAAILIGAQACAQPGGPPKAAEDDAGYRAATGLLHRDLPEQAAAEYRAFLRDHPRYPQAANARYGLAVCLARLGQWKDAAAELDEVLGAAEFEFAPDALLLRAQCAISLNDREAAVAASRALLDRFPKFEHADGAAALLGESLYGAGQAEEARAVLERLAKEWPQSAARPRGEYILALIEARAGQDRQAAARLESLRSACPQSELIPLATLTEAQCLHRASLADPAKVDRGQADRALKLYDAARKSGQEQVVPEAMLGAGQLTRAIGKPADAGRTLDALLERFAKLPIADAARLERARAYLDENHPDKALVILADMSPDGALAPDREYWSAKCEVRLDRFEPAAQRLAQAIEHSPRSALIPDMLYDRAWAMTRVGHSAEAQAAFAQFREKFPDHALVPDALAAEVTLALSRGDNDGAAALAARFLKAYPSHPRAGAVEAALGDAQLAAGHADLAAESYASFLRDHPDDPGSRSAALRNGLALAKLGKAEEAARVLSGAIDAKGEADPALLRAASAVLADAAIAAGDWPGAEARLRTLTLSPEGRTPSALLKLGLAVERSGRTEEALSLFEEVAREDGDAGVQAAFERGQILAGQGKADEAKAAFELVIAREEKAPTKRFTVHALRHLASLASQQGRAEDAAELLGRVAQSPDAGSAGPGALYDQGVSLLSAGKFEEAESVLDRFIRQAPDHARVPDARAQQAIAASRRGEYERAIPMMDAAEGAAGHITPAVGTSMRYERAWALNALQRADESRRAYAALLAEPLPASLEAHAALDLAQLLIAADDHTGAIALLARAGTAARAAGADDGVGERALYLRGLCELKSDHAAEAAATLDEFLRAHPKSELAGAAALLAGQAELRNHRPELAIERLSRVVGASPPPEQLGPALLCLGEALGAAQQWDKSLTAFERYLKEFADSELWFQARFGAAWALENQGRQAEAIGAYREVVSRHKGPTAARAQFQIGECLFAQKRHDDAVRELLKVDILYDYPEWSAAALYEAGRCLTQLDKPDEARRQFQQVTERFKDTEWASLAARQLKDTAAAPLPGSAAGAH